MPVKFIKSDDQSAAYQFDKDRRIHSCWPTSRNIDVGVIPTLPFAPCRVHREGVGWVVERFIDGVAVICFDGCRWQKPVAPNPDWYPKDSDSVCVRKVRRNLKKFEEQV